MFGGKFGAQSIALLDNMSELISRSIRSKEDRAAQAAQANLRSADEFSAVVTVTRVRVRSKKEAV